MNINNFIFSFLSMFSYHAALDWTDSKLIDTYGQGFKVYLNESEDNPINSTLSAGLGAFNDKALGDSTYDPYTIVMKTKSGDVIAGLIAGLSKSTEPKIGNTCYIQALWVDKRYQNQRLANVLLQKLMHYAKNQDFMGIGVSVNGYDEFTKEFFEKMGFKVTAFIPGPIEDPKYQRYEMFLHLVDMNYLKALPDTIHGMSISTYDSKLSHLIHYAAIETIIGNFKSDIVKKLGSFNQDYFTVFITLPSGEVVGGAISNITKTPEICFCYIDVIWINEKYRAHKLGSKVMQEVEKYAKEKHCTYIYLGTGAWQARPFYEKLGYNVVSVLPNPNNYKEYEQYVMRKAL